ncbi:MAG TPA: DUF2752 domain-containing protein [Microlunatus sp.]
MNTARPSGSVRGLVGLGAFVAAGLALSGIYRTTGIGVPCPIRAFTGWQCPFCGATRMGAELMQGHLSAAFDYNPAVLIALVVLVVLGVVRLIGAIGGPTLRLPRPIAARVRRVPGWMWICVAAVAAVLYAVLRNLL